MKSKKSFFNKTMFWKDIIRLWPLWVIGIIITLFSFAVPFFTDSVELLRYGGLDLNMYRAEILDEIRNSMVEYSITNGYYLSLMAVMAIICAVLVFQYLNRQCSSYMLHSLPVNRKNMYVTHYLSGFFMYILPYLLLWCVLGCLNILFGIHMGAAILGYVLETLTIALFFYSLACFIVMLSSSSIISLFFYAVINVMVCVFDYMVEEVVDLFTYGEGAYYTGGFDWQMLVKIFTPGMYFIDALEKQQFIVSDETEKLYQYAVDGLPLGHFHYGSVLLCLIYVIPAIVFFVAACMLYQRRKLERVDENLVFPWSKVIYRVVFCCCGSYIFTWLMYYMTYAIFSHLVTYQYAFLIAAFYLLIGAVLCYLICDMILAKSFFIWKRLSYLQMGVITVGIILVFLAGHHVYLQYSTANASQIKSVDIMFNDASFQIAEEERIDTILKFQKSVMEYGSQRLMYEADNPNANSNINEMQGKSCRMAFTYVLENKMEIHRSYRIGITTDEEQLLTDIILYLNDTDYLIDTVLPKDFYKETLIDIKFEHVEDYYMSRSIDGIDIPNHESMYDALMKDLQEGHIVFGNIYKKNQRGLVDRGKRIGTLLVDYYSVLGSFKSRDGRVISVGDDYDYDDGLVWFEFEITDECTHVLKVLEQEEKKEE